MVSTTAIGILAGLGAIIISILLGEGVGLSAFLDVPAAVIALIGAITATFAAYPLKTIKSAGIAIKHAFIHTGIDLQKDIDSVINIANVARREGLLAMESIYGQIESPFFKKGAMLIVDGADPELIRSILESEIYFIEDRHARGRAVFETLGEMGPAFGLIGTLIAMVRMLNGLSDPATLGKGMATALMTTLYGLLLANLICIPIAKKLKQKSDEEVQELELLLEGLLSIQAGENPHIIKDKLNAFLARSGVKDDGSVRRRHVRVAEQEEEQEELT